MTIPEFIVSATALAASVVAAAVGLQQLLTGPRLRHMETMLREASAAATDENQKRVLQSMHAATLGRIIARDAVPGLTFLPSVLAIGLALTGAVGVGLRDPSEWRLSSLVTFVLLGWTGLRPGTRLVGERLRVARAYENGESPVRAFTDPLAKMEGGRQWEIWLALLTSAALVLASARGASALRSTEVDGWQHVVPTLGGAMAAGTALSVTWIWLKRQNTTEPRNRDNSLKPVWAHPRGVVAGPPEGPPVPAGTSLESASAALPTTRTSVSKPKTAVTNRSQTAPDDTRRGNTRTSDGTT